MNTISLQSSYELTHQEKRESVLGHFFAWTNAEQKNRIAWVGICLTVMTAVFFPVTMASILFNGANFLLIIGAMISLVLVLVPNLAALPTKYTIPAFITGIAMDIAVMIASFIL